MKKLRLPIALFLIISFAITSCSEQEHKEHESSASKETHLEHHEHDHDRDHTGSPEVSEESFPLASLSLNEGSKWQTNPETFEAVHDLDELLDVFLLESEHTDADYARISAELRSGYQKVFSVCTMKGDAHDELHTFLIAVDDMITGLETEDRAHALDQLHTQLHVFAIYFE